MDGKLSTIENKPNNNMTKFHVVKTRPLPIVFNSNNKNGPSSPKKIKFYENNNQENTNPHTTTSTNNNTKQQQSLSIKKLSILEQRRKLPIFANRNKLLDLISKHNTLIVLGETGSGKTTQLPQYLLSARMQKECKIAVTQPRRVAAISVAMRVAQEIGDGYDVGHTIGYAVRFEDCTSKSTKVKYLTDGMLLRESIYDKLLMDYNIVILDEAHERTIHTDVLFGIVKEAQKTRKEKLLHPLKVIIMSATMDVDHFSRYFNNCQAVYLEGRTYPVNVFYSIKPHDDYATACVATFFKIHREAPPDHGVLIFLTGQEEIETACHQIRILSKDCDVDGPPVKVCALYAAQTGTQQLAVFQSVPQNTRKVVICTNVAETSVTIPGIKYVIDSGMVKARTYHPATGLDMLKIQKISQEQSWQRTGRAGRESEGTCYRLYTRKEYENMKKTTIPEIQRANLTIVAIELLALGIHAIYFDFMDKPPRESILAGFEQLKLLGAIDSVDSDKLTPLGQKLAKFPLDPRYSKILIMSQKFGCVEEALTIVSLLSSENIFANPPSRREQVSAVRQKFNSPYGDHVTMLNVYREFNNVGQSNKKTWCQEHFINVRNIFYAREVRSQLCDICKKCGINLSSCGSNVDQIRKCLITGLFTNIAELNKDRQYITLDKRQPVYVHPSSVIHGQRPHFLLFTEVVQTSKCYMRNLSTIECEWIQEIVPEYIKSYNIRYNK